MNYFYYRSVEWRTFDWDFEFTKSVDTTSIATLFRCSANVDTTLLQRDCASWVTT